ncbi:Protein WVD2-like 7 [Bienertia sinuspersici]
MILSTSNMGDPIRALGESISFGRYMSETLAWEKWSAFSHNRYLEEAAKSSKPGSVAKMKAYFEAHYKKVGVKKQAALEQANDSSRFVEPEVKNSKVELNSNSSSSSSSPVLSPKTALPSIHSTCNEIRRSLSSPALHPDTALLNSNVVDDELNVEPLSSVIVSTNDSSPQTKESENEEASVIESSLNIDCKECSPAAQVYQGDDAEVNGSSITENSLEIKVIQSKDAMESGGISNTPKCEVTIEKEGKDKLEPKSKQKLADSSLKSSKKSNLSKLSSSLARLATPVRPKMEGNSTPRYHKSRKESVEDKKPTPKSVQMSMDVNSDAKLKIKASPASHKPGIGKAFTPVAKIVRQSFAQTQTPAPSTNRASVNSVSRHPSATPQSETKRIALEKSFAKNRTDQKIQSPAVGNMKSQVQSPITFSPFSFRTEERAVKRREFFERRLEKEAEKMQQLEKAKVKSKAEFRKVSQSVNFSNAAANSRREVLSDKTKIPTALPHPPKCESKPSTNLAQGKRSQLPRGSASSKLGSGNKKSIPITLPTKKRHENDSPNIL